MQFSCFRFLRSLFVDSLSYDIFLPPSNEVCEGYVFTGVCLSTGAGGDAWQGGMHGRGHALGGMHGRGTCMAGHACTHTPRQILRDMVNERTVKECRSIVREEALYLTMLSAVTPTL